MSISPALKSLPLFSEFSSSLIGKELLKQLSQNQEVIVLSGLTGSAKCLALALIQQITQKRLIYILSTSEDIEVIEPDLRYLVRLVNGMKLDNETDGVHIFPIVEGTPYQGTPPHPKVLEERAITLSHLAEKSGKIYLLPARTLIEKIIPHKDLKLGSTTLNVGEEYPFDYILQMLVEVGYIRREPVTTIGEFSQRGGILDIFSPAHSNPIRLEFLDDTLESIREFDIETQLSVARKEECQILPVREVKGLKNNFITWSKAAAERWKDDRFKYELKSRLEAAEYGEEFSGWEYLIPLTHPLEGSVFEYLNDTLLVVDEPSSVEQIISSYYKNMASHFQTADEAGELALPPEYFLHSPDFLIKQFENRRRIELRVLGVEAAATDASFIIDGISILPEVAQVNFENSPLRFLFQLKNSQSEIRIGTQQGKKYSGRIPQLVADLREARKKGETTLLVMPSLGVAERIVEMFREYEFTATLSHDPQSIMASPEDFKTASCIATVGNINSSFHLPSLALQIIVENDIFVEAPSAEEARLSLNSNRRKNSISSFLSDFRDLKIGDYVVHVDHGVGKFQGLQQIIVDPNAAAREFMLLTYADDAKLFVPVERLDLVQKYSSAESQSPQLDKLGGIGWAKTKARVKRAMRDMAEELLKLHAERQLVKGYAFSPDGPWQKEFEEAFPYDLTRDQQQAVADIKSDLESDIPMDRLLCGDVGFGKTEVAMQAAFKVVMESKQVAVLTPTTVLAFQHWKTFRERFTSFPVTIEMISRFRTPKEQKLILEKVSRGEIDILIGTHRLLSKDVGFADLGLVVIDEEQRFGVTHKEKLKHFRRKIDVLTLSATPIPRTLNISLAGLRSMSVIETPPRDRLAIHTAIVQFSEASIKGAIESERARGGQIFFVHNRVETIFTIAELLQRLVPNVRIGVGHGQMGEKELEAVMMKFVHHELDILVCTTIIENGIDIPLANTIIINHAEHYGLAQLYQLRGRVGRSNRRAYAYLLIPPEGQLTGIARQRLAAIREFSDLGSGFRIAALDLELRGAGNMLGGEQSGHLDSVGFDLYCQMLEHTVKELRGLPEDEEINTAINLNVDIRLPEDYIQDTGQRLRTYKRISSAVDDEVLDKLGQELDDRYGSRPIQVMHLFEYSKLRHRASHLGIISIDYAHQVLSIKFSKQTKIQNEQFLKLILTTPGASISPSGLVKFHINNNSIEVVYETLYKLFSIIEEKK